MKKLWLWAGVATFWCAWPALWLYLHNSKRTRLLLICGDEFLVLRGWLSSGGWSLPGGGLHKDEASLDGLIREVREETGFTLTKDQITFLYAGKYTDFHLDFSYDCYVTKLNQKPVIRLQPGEIVDCAWQPLKSPTLRLGQDTQEALRQWLSKG